MRLTVSALLFFTAATAAGAATDAELKTKILGSWGASVSCSDSTLVFNADGTFVSKGPDGGPPEDNVNGTYTIANGKLSGKTADFEMPTVAITLDGENLVMGEGVDADTMVHCK